MKTDSKIIVKARNIFKDFGDDDIITPVLHDINLDIYYGKLTMIVGPSGCGKTTLISILTGILSHSSGEVFIDDINLTALPDHEKILLRRKKMGFIFQQYNLLSSLTSSENAAIPLIASGMKMDLAIKESNKILESIGMAAHLNKLPNQLSGGQQQRVAIARALVHKPKLIVCDEPTAALDADTGHKIMEILKSMAVNDGVAIIVVTHDSRIFDFADQIIYLEDGKIVNKNNN